MSSNGARVRSPSPALPCPALRLSPRRSPYHLVCSSTVPFPLVRARASPFRAGRARKARRPRVRVSDATGRRRAPPRRVEFPRLYALASVTSPGGACSAGRENFVNKSTQGLVPTRLVRSHGPRAHTPSVRPTTSPTIAAATRSDARAVASRHLRRIPTVRLRRGTRIPTLTKNVRGRVRADPSGCGGRVRAERASAGVHALVVVFAAAAAGCTVRRTGSRRTGSSVPVPAPRPSVSEGVGGARGDGERPPVSRVANTVTPQVHRGPLTTTSDGGVEGFEQSSSPPRAREGGRPGLKPPRGSVW